MDILDRLLEHDRWTTRLMINIAKELTDAQVDREFDMGHRTVRNTLDHIIWNVECWTDLAMEQTVRTRESSRMDIAELAERYESAIANFHDLAHSIQRDGKLDHVFVDSLDSPPQEKTHGGVIVHLATHAMHHRAQLLWMFRQLGVANLPEGDVLTWEASIDTSR